MSELSNDRIIRRVRRLLSLAEGEGNINESQSAFIHAQEMMIKYGIDPNEVNTSEPTKEILTRSATEYKKLWWWERRLANVIAENFRCDWYYNSKRFESKKQIQRKIMFIGYEDDIELATEMYALAHNAAEFYTNRFIRKNNIQGNRSYTIKVKNDYIRGFIDGLEQKFEEQIASQEWGLVVVVPKEVREKEQEITKDGDTLYTNVPDLESYEHYQKGYEEGNAIDYTKSTIDSARMG